MKIFFHLALLLLIANSISMLSMESQSDFCLQRKSNKLGQTHLSDHCVRRMAERAISQDNILSALHGHRYHQEKGRILCVSLKQKVGAILDPKRNIVITVIPNLTQNKLQKRLEKRVMGGKSIPGLRKESTPSASDYPVQVPEVDEFDAFRIEGDNFTPLDRTSGNSEDGILW